MNIVQFQKQTLWVLLFCNVSISIFLQMDKKMEMQWKDLLFVRNNSLQQEQKFEKNKSQIACLLDLAQS